MAYKPLLPKVIKIIQDMGLVPDPTTLGQDPKNDRVRFSKPDGSVSVTVTRVVTMVYRHTERGKLEVARFAIKDVTRKALARAFRLKPEIKGPTIGALEARKAERDQVVAILEANGFVYDRSFNRGPGSNGKFNLLDPVSYTLPQTPLFVVIATLFVTLYQRQLDGGYNALAKIRVAGVSRPVLETLLSKWMPR